MAVEPWSWLLATDAAELYAAAHAGLNETSELIERSREAIESSRALLERTRSCFLLDLAAR